MLFEVKIAMIFQNILKLHQVRKTLKHPSPEILSGKVYTKHILEIARRSLMLVTHVVLGCTRSTMLVEMNSSMSDAI